MPKVFLSAGHGGTKPGASAYGLVEKTINLNIMLACRNVLMEHNITVVCSRTIDENDPIQQEVQEANKSGADVAVSFHTNAGGRNGSESYYYESSDNGKRLAELCEKYTQTLGQNSRGIKTNNLAFTRDTRMTAVLCECAFIDNDKDNDMIDTLEKQQAFGIAYAKAILEYFGVNYNGNYTPETKPKKIAEDGILGKESNEATQRYYGTYIDGIISRQPLVNKNLFLSIDARYWEFTENYGNGSPAINAWQQDFKNRGYYLDSIDGLMGPKMIIALQQFLATLGLYNGKIDGYLGKKCGTSWQKYLNLQ
ncbi:N-acetylmuramoyl-L-alanine amidase [Faecalimonas sp.]